MISSAIWNKQARVHFSNTNKIARSKVIFQNTNFSVIYLVLDDRRNLSGHGQKSACDKSSSCRFSFSAARNAITKATQYPTFGFLSVFWFSSSSRKV